MDEYTQIVKDLAQFESRYEMSSQEFYIRFQQGKLGDDINFVNWATKYEIFKESKEELVLYQRDNDG